jgi:hypothetical protein
MGKPSSFLKLKYKKTACVWYKWRKNEHQRIINIFLDDVRKQVMGIETDSTPLEDPKNQTL